MGKKLRLKSPARKRREFEEIVAKASTGDFESLRQLQKKLDEQPEIWQTVGNLSRNAELAMLRLIGGPNALLKESVERSLELLRRDISPRNPSPLEKLLVERVVFTWMRVQYIETNYATTAELSLQEKKYVLQQRESAQRLFDAAVKSLRTVHSKLGQLPAPTQSPSPVASQKREVKLRVFRSAG